MHLQKLDSSDTCGRGISRPFFGKLQTPACRYWRQHVPQSRGSNSPVKLLQRSPCNEWQPSQQHNAQAQQRSRQRPRALQTALEPSLRCLSTPGGCGHDQCVHTTLGATAAAGGWSGAVQPTGKLPESPGSQQGSATDGRASSAAAGYLSTAHTEMLRQSRAASPDAVPRVGSRQQSPDRQQQCSAGKVTQAQRPQLDTAGFAGSSLDGAIKAPGEGSIQFLRQQGPMVARPRYSDSGPHAQEADQTAPAAQPPGQSGAVEVQHRLHPAAHDCSVSEKNTLSASEEALLQPQMCSSMHNAHLVALMQMCNQGRITAQQAQRALVAIIGGDDRPLSQILTEICQPKTVSVK